MLAELTTEHFSASAAIPLLFPPVRVSASARARGWYVDGGTRLNAPIEPSLDVGADRLLVVATGSIAGPVMEEQADDEEPPDLGPDRGTGGELLASRYGGLKALRDPTSPS